MAGILCYLHDLGGGGVERMGVRLCRDWARQGLDVTLVVGRAEGGEAPALPFRRLPDSGVSTRRFETLWMLVWLPAIVLRAAPDILFCAGNSYSFIAVVLRLLLGRRCPVIVAKISNDLDRCDLAAPVRWLYHLWCRIQGRLIHRFVVLSEAMRDEACERLGVLVSRIEVIPDPVLTDTQAAALAAAGRAARASASPAGRRILAIGRLERQKNWPLLIRAFARGAAPGDRLAILGEGSQRRRIERLVARHGLAERVELPGQCADIAPWIARGDLFVLSSDYEGLPAVLVEALAAGMPIIATDCCRSISETLTATDRALLVPVGDEAALARAVAHFAPPPAEPAADLTLRFRADAASRLYRRLFALANPPSLLSIDGADRVHPCPERTRGDLAAGGAGAA